jgi:hypothetical protein
MLELPHVAVGAAIATFIPNPLISVPVSIASHFIGDYIPHWNPHLQTELKTRGSITFSTASILMADSSLAALTGYSIIFSHISNPAMAINILLCCAGAVLPDIVEIPLFFFHYKNKFLAQLAKFQKAHQWNVPLLPGLFSQAVVILLSLAVIYR